MNKILKKILICIVGVVTGYLIYYNVLMELIAVLYGAGGTGYYIVSVAVLLFSMLGCCLILEIIVERKMTPLLFYSLSACYFAILLFALFFRRAIEREFILNPLDSLTELNQWDMALQTIINFAMFIPFGYYLRKINKAKYVLLVSVGVSFAIELIQGITQRGFFDTFDIIVYCLGIFTGYKLSRKLLNGNIGR